MSRASGARRGRSPPGRSSDAVLELFTERGYEDTTVQNIAQRAGLATSRFLRRFKDKRDVLFGEDALPEPLLAGIAAARPRPARCRRWRTPLTQWAKRSSCPDVARQWARGRAVIDAHPPTSKSERASRA
ncbi:TetR/AcrR family transcriptional regulator [Streptomyces sp. SMS_SU21]|nr:TetR/AcrR family transcriptional regulator [Streptomyces sp. SMS_SU21]